MKKWIQIIFIGLGFALTSNAFAKVEMDDANLKFSFATQDGEYSLTCRHWKTVKDIPEWEVLCGEGGSIVKSFRAHFIIEELSKSQFSYYYIVTDRTQKSTSFKSSAAKITAKNSVPVNALTLDQGVENDTGFLTLEYTR